MRLENRHIPTPEEIQDKIISSERFRNSTPEEQGRALANLRHDFQKLKEAPVVQACREEKRDRLSTVSKIVDVLEGNIIPKGVQIGEIGGRGKIEKIAGAIVDSKIFVTILCPDFETTLLPDGSSVFVPGGKMNDGVGFVGERLMFSLPLIENIGAVLQGNLMLVPIYHASSEPIVNDGNRHLIFESAEKLKKILEEKSHSFNFKVNVINDPSFLESAGNAIPDIIKEVGSDELLRIGRRRSNIIKMRLGLSPGTFVDTDKTVEETALDIAIHRLTENFVAGNFLTDSSFVHLTADSATFASFYRNPSITLCRGEQMRYEGDK